MTKEEILKQQLSNKGLKFINPRGNPKAPVWLIGEAGGADEEREGTSFVGASGKELGRMLSEAGFNVSDCYFTNVYKVRPIDNKLDRIGEYGIPENLYLEQLHEEISWHKPTIIVTLGAVSTGTLCPQTLGQRKGGKVATAQISLYKGSILSSSLYQWPHYIIPSSHPAYVLRDWSERQIAVLCLAKAKEELDYVKQHGVLQPLPQRNLITDSSFGDTVDFLNMCLNTPASQPISIDIENIGVYSGKDKTVQHKRLPYTIAFAPDPYRAISIELSGFGNAESREIWRLIDRILKTKRQIGQNYYTHDAPWMEYIGFSPNIRLLNDTLVRHHVLWPELDHKLQFQTMQYCREPYYKNEAHGWTVKNKTNLKKYNCKDVCVTYEIWQRQEEEFDDNPKLREFYNYEQRLANVFFNINKRGVQVDSGRLVALREHIKSELQRSCSTISAAVSVPVQAQAVSKGPKKKDDKTVNLSSPKQVVEMLKGLGLKPPKKRGSQNETSDEEAIQEMFAKTGHPVLKEILRVRELNKVLGTYVDVKLYQNILYSAYFVTGTITGRRSSRSNFLGLGTNCQNLPKHSELAKRFRECIVARPGKIFLSCDQVSAEDWLVQGLIADLSGDRRGLDQLIDGVDRHAKTAAFLLGKPESQCGKNTPERFMGKKFRHGGNYDMEAFRMSVEFAKEGHAVPMNVCSALLERFHQYDPGIRGVFQAYVKHELNTKRTLTTPFGRVRQFFSLRDRSDNKKIYKEGYAQIPQSTVGDNTGMAILWLEENFPGYVVMDGHDAVVLEVDDSPEAIRDGIEKLRSAFDRVIRFPNGLELTIPIEYELGYNLKDMKGVEPNESSITTVYNKLRSSATAVPGASVRPVEPLGQPQMADVESGASISSVHTRV